MKAFVYFNIREQLFSLRSDVGSDKGKIIMHARRVLLRDVTFRVSEAGRQRVILEQRESVHAGVVGSVRVVDVVTQLHDILVGPDGRVPATWHPIVETEHVARIVKNGREISYNPYRAGHFVYVDDDCEPVERADEAYMVVDDYDRARTFVLDNSDTP